MTRGGGLKLQRISLTDPLLLRKLVLDQINELPGRVELLEENLASESGPLCLGIDEERRLVLIHTTVHEDTAILVRVLSQMKWMVRSHALLSRVFSNQGVASPQTPRAVLIAPSFSTPFMDAVTYTGADIELHRYQALEIDRQTALLLDPVWIPQDRKPKPAVPISTVAPSVSSRIELTNEERSFFEGSPPKNLSM
jgi:hypothetical protein